MQNKLITWIFLLFITSLAFLYRVNGLLANHPFWVDEFSTANQAYLILKYGLEVFSNPEIHLESNNVLTHFIVAAFFRLFEQKEWVARLPFVILGSLIPGVTFFLARRFFGSSTAIYASLLTVFSYFQIVWSRQARGYMLVQLIILLSMLLYLKIIEDKKRSILNYFLFSILILLGILTHSLFYIFLITLTIHYLLFNFRNIKPFLSKPWIYLMTLPIVFIGYKIGFFKAIYITYGTGLIKANNLWYYHSFLWREYGLITFFAIIGLIVLFIKNKSLGFLFTIYIGLQLIFLSFLFAPYVSRYSLPIFPLLLILMSYALVQTTSRFHKILPIVLVLFIIVNGNKFVTKPKTFYSVNHDFREIALIDYNQVYDLIKEKGQLKGGKTAVIDTWHDRLYWYMGRDYPHSYMFRWINNPGLTNGLPKKTVFFTNSEGEKIIPRTNNLRFIGELSDLKKAMDKYPKGFIFIDDTTLPKDVVEYAEKNFKKELYLDHYPLDDNPYSIWPATLYSWGIQ